MCVCITCVFVYMYVCMLRAPGGGESEVVTNSDDGTDEYLTATHTK